MKKAVIYTTPTCGFCRRTKEYLKEKGVDYAEFDVSVDSQKAQEMVDLSGQMGVPVLVVGDGEEKDIIIGFDQPKIDAALGL